jgi:hypothetical protein
MLLNHRSSPDPNCLFIHLTKKQFPIGVISIFSCQVSNCLLL